MAVRFASFNVENLFARPRAFNMATWNEGEPILGAFRELNALFALAEYDQPTKDRMIELLLQLEVYRRSNGLVRRNRTSTPRWAWLRANRGSFDVEREATGVEIVAHGRSDWTGWVELATEPVDEIATRMTARVISDVAADVLTVIEAENRPSLDRFNEELLANRYAHCMLIDGNDDRGIDVGIMTTSRVDIAAMRSNVDVADSATGEHLFSRDCPEYLCEIDGAGSVWVLANHFKSQSGGGGDKRRRQSEGVIAIVNRLLADDPDTNIVVMGDLNEGPAALGELPKNLAPLFDPSSPLVDVYTLPTFKTGPRPGTFQSSGIRNRLDYILVSRALAGRVVDGGIERRGLWGGPTNVNPPAQWEIYPDITGARHAASDHAAIFVDIDL